MRSSTGSLQLCSSEIPYEHEWTFYPERGTAVPVSAQGIHRAPDVVAPARRCGGPVVGDFDGGEDVVVDGRVMAAGFHDALHFPDGGQSPYRISASTGRELRGVADRVLSGQMQCVANASAILESLSAITPIPFDVLVGVSRQTLLGDQEGTSVKAGNGVAAIRLSSAELAAPYAERQRQCDDHADTRQQRRPRQVDPACQAIHGSHDVFAHDSSLGLKRIH